MPQHFLDFFQWPTSHGQVTGRGVPYSMPGKDERPISRFATREAERTIPIAQAAEGGYRAYTPPDFARLLRPGATFELARYDLPIILSPFAQGSAEMFCIVQIATI